MASLKHSSDTNLGYCAAGRSKSHDYLQLLKMLLGHKACFEYWSSKSSLPSYEVNTVATTDGKFPKAALHWDNSSALK